MASYANVINYRNCPNPEMQGFGNWSLTIPSCNEHFACFPKNLLNQGLRYKEPSMFKTKPNLKCDHSNESYWAVLSCGTVYYAVQGGSNFQVRGWNPQE